MWHLNKAFIYTLIYGICLQQMQEKYEEKLKQQQEEYYLNYNLQLEFPVVEHTK